MRWSRNSKRLLRRVFSIYHKIELLFLIPGVITFTYLLGNKGEFHWAEFARLTLIGLVIAGALLYLMFRVVRRRLGNGIVSASRTWSSKNFSSSLEDCEAGYLFVGNSFEPYLDAFTKGFSSSKGKVFLVLAPVEKAEDVELGRAHLEVIEALKNYDVQFLTMERARSWWMHVFNVENETKGFVMLGLNPPTGESIILELEKAPKRYGLFEHFLSEAKDLRGESRVENVGSWSKHLRRISAPQKDELR